MAQVWIPPAFRDLTAGKDMVAASGANVREVIAALDRSFPGIKGRLCAGDGLRPGISVVVDSNVAPLGLLARVGPNSEVHFLPAVGGGQ